MSKCLHPNFHPEAKVSKWDTNPVHKHDDGTWWYFDETWANDHGPFKTEAEARADLQEYIETI